MRVLVAPLHWGLGHATRCIPIITDLLQQNHSVHIAADGRALALLRNEFPNLPYTELQGYDIQYPNSNHKQQGELRAILTMAWAMLYQTPRILYRIWQEYRQTQTLVKKHQINLIIADNRYGCHTAQTRNIFICHQIFIQIPKPFAWLMPIVAYIHRLFINQFDECWIPDHADPHQSLSGKLSRLKPLPNHYKFIGILSRFAPKNSPLINTKTLSAQENTLLPPHFKPFVLVLISGPEPQRSIFETLIIAQTKNHKGNVLIVRGIAEGDQSIKTYQNKKNILIADHLNAQHLGQIMTAATSVIARAGYSTIMDLAALNKKAILIPTPGQTEQLYLGKYLAKKGLFECINQNDILTNKIL